MSPFLLGTPAQSFQRARKLSNSIGQRQPYKYHGCENLSTLNFICRRPWKHPSTDGKKEGVWLQQGWLAANLSNMLQNKPTAYIVYIAIWCICYMYVYNVFVNTLVISATSIIIYNSLHHSSKVINSYLLKVWRTLVFVTAK